MSMLCGPSFSHSYSTSALRHVALLRPSCATSWSSFLPWLACSTRVWDGGSRTGMEGSSRPNSSDGSSPAGAGVGRQVDR